jgi:hypothetical protein
MIDLLTLLICTIKPSKDKRHCFFTAWHRRADFCLAVVIIFTRLSIGTKFRQFSVPIAKCRVERRKIQNFSTFSTFNG